MKQAVYTVITFIVLLSLSITQVFSIYFRDNTPPPATKASERSCTEEYAPVCTTKQVTSNQCIGSTICIRTVNTTFDNSCLAHKA